jgi:hypothetical protein
LRALFRRNVNPVLALAARGELISIKSQQRLSRIFDAQRRRS